MSTCSCAPAHLTSVSFAHGIEMQRCRRHELQTWTQDGRTTDERTVRRLLKDLFVETRGTRSTSPAGAHAPARWTLPAQPQATSHASSEVALDAGADAALTALLRSRGLHGSWSVA